MAFPHAGLISHASYLCRMTRAAEKKPFSDEDLCRIFKSVKFSLSSPFFLSLFLFPQAGPDIKYLLGFVRTQLSTTTTIILVFGPKILRVLRGQGDKWDHRSRARGITASFCINGGGLMPEEGVDLYQENEELKVKVLMKPKL